VNRDLTDPPLAVRACHYAAHVVVGEHVPHDCAKHGMKEDASADLEAGPHSSGDRAKVS